MNITSIEGLKPSSRFMSDELLVVLTTLPGEWEEYRVGSFAQHLLESGAACVEYSSIQSIYKWEGEIISSKEWKLEIKLAPLSKNLLLRTLDECHPYDVPQLVCLSAETSELYSSWASHALWCKCCRVFAILP